MKELFVDTSAWDVIEYASDANYEIALLFKEKIAERIYRLVTTSYVLDETYTLLLLNKST